MARAYDRFGLHGKIKTGQDNLALDIVEIVDNAHGNRTTLLTELVIYIQKREAVVWQDGFKKGKKG